MTTAAAGVREHVRPLRWNIAVLLSAAIAISYLDRQSLSVAVTAIQQDIPLSNIQFSRLQAAFLLAYAVMYAGGGVLIDRLGTRRTEATRPAAAPMTATGRARDDTHKAGVCGTPTD